MENIYRGDEGREIGREFNPAHKIFWTDMAFFLGLGLAAAWQTWDYAMYKARAGNKGYLFSGAHHLWRVVFTFVIALLLIIAEMISPGRSNAIAMHYVVAFGMLFDAILLYIHTERYPIPLVFPTLEAMLSICLAFGVSDKGRLTSPIILLVASFRFAAEFWPLKKDEDCFKIVSATLCAALAWHWFPLQQAISLFAVEEVKHGTAKYDAYNASIVDLMFCINVFIGHGCVLVTLWKILPDFFSDELAYERHDTTVPQSSELPSW